MKAITKIDLRDVSFLIPVRIDSADRLENLEIVVRYLTTYFDTFIYVMEVDEKPCVTDFIKSNTRYYFRYSGDSVFRRTEINNQLIHACDTPVAVLYDTDVIVHTTQILTVAKMIRKKLWHFSIPYDGRFLQVDYYNKQLFKKTLNIDFLSSGTNLYGIDTNNSVGGCFMFSVQQYKYCGMENENIEGWGHDDAERVKRLSKLGHSVFRPEGPLYHLSHDRKRNSYFYDEKRAMRSFETYFRTCALSKEELQKGIKLWSWI